MKFRILVIVLLALLQFSCERITRPKLTETASIELEAVAGLVTEAFIRVKPQVMPENSQVIVYRNGQRWQALDDLKRDTLLHDTGLTPGSEVSYRAEVRKAGEVIGRSGSVQVALRPTTSHEVTWSVYEFDSPYGGGYFSDVAIINEHDVWVVGQIYSDVSSPYEPYNAAHWDGQKWELMKIGVEYRGSNVITAIHSVTQWYDDKVVFSVGLPCLPINDGWKIYHLWDMGILGDNDGSVVYVSKINRKRLIFYGNKGTMVIYNNGQWEKLQKLTDLKIQDIHVDLRSATANPEILAVASDFYHRPGSTLIRIQGENAEIIADSVTIQRGMAGLWFSSGEEYWLVGDGVYRSRLLPKNWKLISDLPKKFSHAISGTDINDIWIAGAYGLLSHFNGKSWHNYGGNELPPYGLFYNVSVAQNIVVAVGTRSNKGYIVMGRRR